MVKSPSKANPKAERECDCSARKRRSGMELVIECGRCDAEPGLENARCFRNVLAAVQRQGAPVAITLRSHVERRYGLAASHNMGLISDILNRVDGLQIQLARDSGKGEACVACVRPLAGRLAVLGNCLRGMDLNGAAASANELENHSFGSSRAGCADCSGMTAVQVADIARSVRTLEKAVDRGSIKISEAE